MLVIGEIIAMVLNSPDDSMVKTRASGLVSRLTGKYPLYADLG